MCRNTHHAQGERNEQCRLGKLISSKQNLKSEGPADQRFRKTQEGSEPSEIILDLYHCKGSGGPRPGDRISDVYEVCGQVVKSFNLIDNEADLIKHVRRRVRSGSRFVKGDLPLFERLLNQRGSRTLTYRFIERLWASVALVLASNLWSVCGP
jgi:hypothetical protein